MAAPFNDLLHTNLHALLSSSTTDQIPALDESVSRLTAVAAPPHTHTWCTCSLPQALKHVQPPHHGHIADWARLQQARAAAGAGTGAGGAAAGGLSGWGWRKSTTVYG
jgi:hypothetical protein